MIQKGLLAIALVVLTTAVAFPAAAQQVIVLPAAEPYIVIDAVPGTNVVRVAPIVVQPAVISSEVRATDEIAPAASVRMDTVGSPWCGGAYANNVGTNFGGCLR